MEKLEEAIASFMRELKSKSARRGSAPQELLKKVLTKQELGHIKCNYFKNGILHIDIDSSTWFYKLSLQREELLSKLQRHSAAIKEIRLRMGKVK